MVKEKIKIKKNTLKVIFFALIIIIIAVLVITFSAPKKISSEEIRDYKIALFGSISCQYSCELTYITLNKQTQILPSQKCIQSCIENLKAKGFNNTKYKDSDLLRDDSLVLDVTTSIDSCSQIYPINYTSSLINNTDFVNCVNGELSSIKEKYPYVSQSNSSE